MGTVDMRDFNVLVLSTIFTLSFVIGQGLEENGFVTDSDNFDTTLIKIRNCDGLSGEQCIMLVTTWAQSPGRKEAIRNFAEDLHVKCA